MIYYLQLYMPGNNLKYNSKEFICQNFSFFLANKIQGILRIKNNIGMCRSLFSKNTEVS